VLLGLRGQLLQMKDVRLVLLIRVIHRNTPDTILRSKNKYCMLRKLDGFLIGYFLPV
jgi:hypothetical protein